MPADPAAVKALFLEAANLPPADRAAFLTARCGTDTDLLCRVHALLTAHDHAGMVNETAPYAGADFAATHSPGDDTRPVSTPTEAAGQVIGERYKLIERIGEGGMGSVWMAEQTESVKRKVAVKLIKPGLDSKQVLARFEAERQALALMEHENIAKVFDGGLHDGRPYFVMELVKGVPITHFCDARKLTPQQRLELFVPVCQAIQHAHQKGIIHRDIKPANVLVALYDDKPVPKVIDFGVAKATGPTLTEHTLETGFGAVVGTPQYMSPEQATFNNLDIDTRSDVYSLGVLLYELLAGSPPFKQKELEKRGLLEMLRVVREEEPPKPSTKLSTADALPSLAANRGTEPKKLTGLLRNELDWIVMKALEKDRQRRYETANGFAADVQRYLSGEPVHAHPPTIGYRLKKFVRKNKGPVTAGAVLFLTLLAGISGTTFGLLRAEERRREAVEAQANTQEQWQRAEREGEEKQTALAAKSVALRHAQGSQALLRSELYRPTNPGLALALAIEGARRNPGLAANNALTAALEDCLELRAFTGHKGEVYSCAFSPDGLRVVSGGQDRTARVWEAATGRELFTLGEHDHPVVHVAYSPDGQRILTVNSVRPGGIFSSHSGSGLHATARLWEAATGRLVARWQNPPPEKVDGHHFQMTAHGVAFSPDGRRVVTTFGIFPDGAPEVRDAATGRLVFTLESHQRPVAHVAYSPDGRWIATASVDKTAILWDAETGKPLHTLTHPRGLIWVAFSPNGKRLLTVGCGMTVSGTKFTDGERLSGTHFEREDTAGRIWDTATGKELVALKWPDDGRAHGYAGAFSPDGKRVVTTSEHYRGHFNDGFPWVWDAETGKPLLREVGRNPEGAVGGFAAFSPDGGGRWLLTMTNRAAYLRDATTGQTRARYLGHDHYLTTAAFSLDGKRVATAGADGTVRVWIADLGSDASARLGSWPAARQAVVSPDGRALVERYVGVGGYSGRLWDLAAGREVATLAEPSEGVSLAAFSPDGTKVVTASDSIARVWDARTGNPLAALVGHSRRILAAAFDPTGTRVATSSEDGTARVWDAKTGREVVPLQKPDRMRTGYRVGNVEQFVGELSFSPDGKQVFGAPAGIANWFAAVWDATTGKEVRVLWHPDNGMGNSHFDRVLPDGRMVAKNPTRVWDASGDRVVTSEAKSGSLVLAVSPDGRLIAEASDLREVCLTDTRSGKIVRTLNGPTGHVVALAFSHAGDRVVGASAAGAAHVWDVTTGEEVLTLPAPNVTSVGFTPNDRQVLTAGVGARLRPADPLAAAEARRPRDLTPAERTRFGLGD